MKLSDAIMLNGMTKPQGRGFQSLGSVDSPCAIGGALQIIGKQSVNDSVGNYVTFGSEWPWVKDDTECQVCGLVTEVTRIIWHLNDFHEWTRQQIAEWVATIEPQEPEQTVEEIPEPIEVAHD